MSPEDDNRSLSFACRCSPASTAFADEIMAWALEWLSHPKYQVTRENLLTAAVNALEWRYRAVIDSIPTDQWSAVITSTHDTHIVDKDPEPVFSTYIQCDEVEDGIAFTLRTYYEKFGDKRER